MLHRGLSRSNGERFLAPGYGGVPCTDWLRRYNTTVLPSGAHFGHKGDNFLWQLYIEEIRAHATTDGEYLHTCSAFLDVPGKLPLPLARYTTLTGAVRSWCMQIHLGSAFVRGI